MSQVANYILKVFREFMLRVCTFYLLDDNSDIVVSVGQMPIIINNESKQSIFRHATFRDINV